MPYAHLSNRHYPTIATVPYIDNLYSTKESGGYMVPKNLGATIALSRYNTNHVDMSKIGSIYLNSDIYNTGQGFTLKEQNDVTKNKNIDSEWTKTQFIEGERAGVIKDPDIYQEFVPYQTTYENVKHNKNGIIRQQDTFNDFKQIQELLQDLELVKYNSDVFGNDYLLYKNTNGEGDIHELWIRDDNDNIGKIEDILKNVSREIAEFILEDNNLLSFESFYDTLLFIYFSRIITVKLSRDETSGEFYTTQNDINIIEINDEMKYIDTIFHEDDKKITICFLLKCPGLTQQSTQLRPLLYSLDLNTTRLTLIYNKSSEYTDFWYPGLRSSSFNVKGLPGAVTYDKYRKIFNLSFIWRTVGGMFLFSINTKQIGSFYNVIKTRVIEPVSACKNVSVP